LFIYSLLEYIKLTPLQKSFISPFNKVLNTLMDKFYQVEQMESDVLWLSKEIIH